MLFFADLRDQKIPLFLEANVLEAHECVSSLMYDINSNNALINMLHLFTKTSSIHSYDTQSSTSGNLYINAYLFMYGTILEKRRVVGAEKEEA